MPLDMTLKPSAASNLLAQIPTLWRKPLLHLAFAWLATFALTFRDWSAMLDQWWNISTYNHIIFVPFIVGWLVHCRKGELAKLTPQTWWPGLLSLVVALFLWLSGSLAGVNTVSQLGAVVALQACVVTLLGPRVALANLFPLAFMLFLVPFGDELVPLLQTITAVLVIVLTEWSGIPAVIDGVFIDTPVGLFEVAEACSGVKFLVAMIALGTLISYACFKNWQRRLIFMSAAIALPILANGARAWGTIYIAQFQGVEFAEGFDHIFYGWVFFALVVAILIASAWRWFDRDPEDLGVDFPASMDSAWLQRFSKLTMPPLSALVCVLGLTAIFGMWVGFASRVEAQSPVSISFPTMQDWEQVSYDPFAAWEPRASGADHRLLGRFRNKAGQEVDVFIALYSAQEEGREASAHGEGAFDPGSDWRWIETGPATPSAKSDFLLIGGKHKRLVQTSYRVGDLLTGSAAKLKLANMRDRLLLNEQPTAMLILSSELQGADEAEKSIESFRQFIGDEGEWLDRIAGLR